MKTVFVSAATVVIAATYTSATTCDMGKIQSLLYPNATKGLADCENATGISIFGVNEFPTSEQVKDLSQNVNCANYFNQINQVANAEIQCNVTIQGVDVVFGSLIADFLTGKTGNKTEPETKMPKDEDETLPPSKKLDKSDTDSKTDETITPTTPSTSDALGAHTLSFISYCVATTLALALQ